ncbi:MAG: tRNA lysidine(34) synthetase TilS [Saccharofermentanales bacterium]
MTPKGYSDQDALIKKIEDTIDTNHMLEYGDTILTGVSGGPDSVCMLDVLRKISPGRGYSIEVAHVNHNLRGDSSAADQEFVEEYCRRNDILLHCATIDVIAFSKEHKMGIEEAARFLRYEFFNRCKGWRNVKIAVAHHQQDQSETIFMNIIRGCGLDGIAGMDYVAGDIIRPLLDCTREEIDAYLSFHDIPYRIDQTNMELCADRNKVRLDVLPSLSRRFGRDVSYALCKTGILCRQDAEYLDEESSRIFSEIYVGGSISCELLANLKTAISSRVIRKFYETAKGNRQNLTYDQTLAVSGLIMKCKEGARACLSDGFTAVIIGRRLHMMKSSDYMELLESESNVRIWRESVQIPLAIPEERFETNIDLHIITKFVEKSCEVVYNAQTWCLPLERVSGAIWRYRMAGDWIRPNARSGRKTVKKFLTDIKVPHEAKERLVVLACGNEVLWMPGIAGSRYGCDEDSITDRMVRIDARPLSGSIIGNGCGIVHSSVKN